MHQQGRDKLLASICVDHDSWSECWTRKLCWTLCGGHMQCTNEQLATVHTANKATHTGCWQGHPPKTIPVGLTAPAVCTPTVRHNTSPRLHPTTTLQECCMTQHIVMRLWPCYMRHTTSHWQKMYHRHMTLNLACDTGTTSRPCLPLPPVCCAKHIWL